MNKFNIFKDKLGIVTLLIILTALFFVYQDLRYTFFAILPDSLTESSLERKNIQLLKLENEADYGEIYDEFIDPTLKNRYSREEYVSNLAERREKNGLRYSKINTHEILIRGQEGYIDRTRLDCYNNDCTEKEQKRENRKWIYKNNNWYLTGESPLCIKDRATVASPEFERALSLLSQRYQESSDSERDTYIEIIKCTNIEYASPSESGDEEGFFYFDDSISSPNNLVIKVNPKYQYYDDLSTAFLLSHELVHAKQFVELLKYNKERSCVDQETQAFLQQVNFSAYLNDEETRSLVTRAEKISNNNTQLQIYADLINMTGDSVYECTRGQYKNTYSESDFNCVQERVIEKIRQMIIQTPAYQEQCGL